VVAYDVFLADCPARTTLHIVADTWSVVAVVTLGAGPARYTELQQRIGGISKKMLTQTLRKLEANGLLERRVLGTAPPGTE
jgi:DNA-binding HxlR family transcriptional regulator